MRERESPTAIHSSSEEQLASEEDEEDESSSPSSSESSTIVGEMFFFVIAGVAGEDLGCSIGPTKGLLGKLEGSQKVAPEEVV